MTLTLLANHWPPLATALFLGPWIVLTVLFVLRHRRAKPQRVNSLPRRDCPIIEPGRR
jgi:hypothetical protein